jgi:hypothetical protein
MTMRYKYVILQHQPSLDSAVTENFAILVEGRAGTGWCIFAVGRSPETVPSVSDIANAIRVKFPDVLAGVLEQVAQEKGSTGDVLDGLHKYLRWNYQATLATILEDTDPIEQVAFKLFGQYVARAHQLVTQLGASSGPLQACRIGETFEAAVPIHEPTSELFA